ncbi:MAG: tRNA (adenosine(37)-N6)-threonylcarbamoyltransferase complex ATPase subunit type 1 TsaE [Planctomycetota bacterium]
MANAGIQTLATASAEETEAVGRRLAAGLRGGAVLALEGDLGAGKTTLVRGLAAGLGLDPAAVSSPTFVLVQEYAGDDARLGLAHIDAYRLSGPDELEGLDWSRLLADDGVAIVVEWASRVAAALPASRTTTVTLAATGESARSITIEPPRTWTTCPATGIRVPPDAPSWPFASERARLADLYGWFAGTHTISRPIEEGDDPSEFPPEG